MKLRNRLRNELSDPEFRHAYADEHLNLTIASQIKVLREQQKLSQKDLAEKLGTKQTGISRLESANYSGWSVRVLKKLAEAFDLRLRISFEEFGTLWKEVDEFSREELERRPFRDDPEFQAQPIDENANFFIRKPHHGLRSATDGLVNPQQAQADDKGSFPIDKSPRWNKIPPQTASSATGWIGNGPTSERIAGCI